MGKFLSFSFVTACIFANTVFADQDFHCYSAPSFPVLAYEYAGGKCMKIGDAKKLGEDGEKEIVCMVQAFCEPVDKELAREEPPKLTNEELNERVRAGFLKHSTLVCKATGEIVEGNIDAADCPTANKCRSDIFFNYKPVGQSPPKKERFTAPQEEGKATP